MLRTLLSLAALTSAIAAPAQTTEPAAPRYDVVSIRSNTEVNSPTRWRTTDDSFLANNMSLPMLLVAAYDTRRDLLSGLPAWATNANFDITAKITDADPGAIKKLTPPQRDAMLAKILVERFHLNIHPETKELPVYDLVVAKGGSKLVPNAAVMVADPAVLPKPGMRPGMIMMNRGEFTAEAVSLAPFIQSLANELERNIIDKTGLTQNYDIHLKWTPANTPADAAQPDPAPPLFTAIQEQLGLKLVPAKGPVQTWVVDHIEHPTEN